MKNKKLWLALLLVAVVVITVTGQKRALTVEDLWQCKRLGDPQISPDGQKIAYTLTVYNMQSNKGNTDIWICDIPSGETKQMTTTPGYDGTPRWSPDGKVLTFISNRCGLSQIFTLKIAGGEARQISNIATDVSDFAWTPDGRNLLLVTQVYPGMTPEQTVAQDKKNAQTQGKAKIIDRLLYRHWNHWTEGKYSHVFIMPASGGTLRDLTPGPYDCPPISLGGALDFTVSPDNRTFYFVRNTDSMVATSTNNDIFAVPLTGGAPRRITTGKGNDNSPVCSPDGRYLAYLSMKRPEFRG